MKIEFNANRLSSGGAGVGSLVRKLTSAPMASFVSARK